MFIAKSLDPETKSDSHKFIVFLEKANKKDQELLKLLALAKRVGGVTNKKLFEMGIKNYLKSSSFKEKAAFITRFVEEYDENVKDEYEN